MIELGEVDSSVGVGKMCNGSEALAIVTVMVSSVSVVFGGKIGILNSVADTGINSTSTPFDSSAIVFSSAYRSKFSPKMLNYWPSSSLNKYGGSIR